MRLMQKVNREVLDIRDAAEYLGISPDTLYKYASTGILPAFKLGNRWRFKRSMLDGWIEKKCEPTKVLRAEPGGKEMNS